MRMFPTPGASNRGAGPGLPRRLAAALALALSASSVAPATAEIYRCVGADGRVTFTDNSSACPGAKRHALQPRIQRIVEDSAEPPSAPAAPVRGSTAAATEEASADQEVWQGKKLRAEAELQTLQRLAERLARTVAGCNRGTEFFTREGGTGIKARVSCDEIRQAYADNRAKNRELREYLENGLALECRRAGCLPGWIR